MAVIGNIRKRSGLILGIIGLALVAFILGDFFKKNSGGARNESIGKINGESISMLQFNREVETNTNKYKIQAGTNSVDSKVVDQLRDRTWNQFLQRYILEKEYDKLGVTVSDKEVEDLMYGKFLHPYLSQYFTNQATGRIENGFADKFGRLDGSKVAMFRDQLKKAAEGGQDQKAMKDYNNFLLLGEQLVEDRLRNKYFGLVQKSIYITNFEANKLNDEMNKTIAVRMVAKRYFTVSDSTIKVSADDLQKYYNDHKADYKQKDELRSVQYIAYDVNASKQDTSEIYASITKAKQGLSEQKKDEDYNSFIKLESDNAKPLHYAKKSELQKPLDSFAFKLAVGAVYGPTVYKGNYLLAKVVDKQNRPDSLQANHILIAFKGSGAENKMTKLDEKGAAKLADSIKNAVRKDPAIFDALVKKYSDDGSTKDKAGALGWFKDGAMLPELNELAIKLPVNGIDTVKTVYGIHIVKVTNKTKPVEKVKLAIIEKEIGFSDVTRKDALQKAIKFTDENVTGELFKASILKKGLTPRYANDLRKDQNFISEAIEKPRMLIQWAYKAKIGDVSDVIDMGNKLVIATLTEIKPKGFIPMETVKAEIEAKVRKDKKAEQFIAEFKQLNAKSIEDYAAKLKTRIDTAKELRFSQNFLPNMGGEQPVIGSAFALKKGVLSSPIKGDQGVYVLIVDDIKEAPKATNLIQLKQQYLRNYTYNLESGLFDALKDNVEIIDNRIDLY